MSKRHSQGVSLIEVMVAVGVIGILVSVVAPSFADLLNRRRVQAVAAEITSDLAYARAETGLRPQDVTVYFKMDRNCYTIAGYGETGECDCSSGSGNACPTPDREFRTMQVPSNIGVTFRADSPSWTIYSRDQLTFESPQMLASVSDFFVVVSGRGGEIRINLNRMGRISTCSPRGSIGGMPVC